MRVEMPSLVRRWSVQHAHGLAVAVDFRNSASDCVGHVDEMIGRNEEAKRVTHLPFAEVATVQVENLDARVFAVAHVNQIAINYDGVRKIELPRAAAFHSPSEEHIAVFVKLQHARIGFAISDVNVSFVVERHVGWLVKMKNIIARHSHSA